MKSIIKNTIYTALLLFPFITLGQGQPYLSESWNKQGGKSAVFYKNATATDNQRNVYVAGTTINQAGNHDIFIQKLNPKGALIWEVSYNGNANMDDGAAAIFVDNEYNIYVTGAVVNSLSTAQDLIVLKYDKNGLLMWEYFYDNNSTPAGVDAGTALIGDNLGNIYVTGSSYGEDTQSDYVTLRLNANNGNEIWKERYDYTELNDVPAKIILSDSFQNLYVSGASQVGANKWELATLFYNASNGNLTGERRSVGNATQGVNEINDLTIDDNGNIYLTGAVNNANSYDIATYKLDENLNILWEEHFDAYGENDKGNGIKVDNQGNVYVAGTVSTLNEGNNYALLKYNSSGVLQWKREFNGEENDDDEAVQLTLSNNLIYVTGLAKNSNHSSFQTLVYKPDGEIYTQAEYTNLNENEKPTGITTDLNGDIIVVGQTELTGGKYRTRTIKYSLYNKPFDPVFESGEPKYNANEVIIRFDRSAINYNAIDRKGFIAGQLDEFVKPSVITEMNDKLGMDVSRLITFKIYGNMTTVDSTSVTRLGDTIKISDLWATLSVIFPKNSDITQVIDSLNTMHNMIHYGEFNHIGKFFGEPNDLLYLTNQTGLFDSIHGINVRGAWDKQVGRDFTKVAVIDKGINWRHEDFGDGTLNGSVISGGKDYTIDNYGINLSDSVVNASVHGTAIGGIIGALRNNGVGISGISGGDIDSLGINGVRLLSFTTKSIPSITNVSNGLYDAAFLFSTDVINISFGIPFYNKAFWELFSNIYRNKCIVSASSGNADSLSLMNVRNYPASFPDEWILKVGGNNAQGTRWYNSVYNHNIDIIAPSVSGIWQSTSLENSSYITGNGTSFASPHVSGATALLLSQHSKETNILYPNDLAPEDIDEILKRTATPIDNDVVGGNNLTVPNKYSGYGRINVGEALNSVSLPYRIHHFEKEVDLMNQTNYSIDTSLFATEQIVTYPIGIPGFSGSSNLFYNADTVDIYKYNVNIVQSNNFLPGHPYIPPNETVIDGWVRNSSCDLYGLTDTIMSDLVGGVSLDYIDENEAILTGYIYKAKLYDENGNYLQDIWYPKYIWSKIKFAYSVYTIDSNPNVGVEENRKEYSIKIYPNPTNNNLFFELSVPSNSLDLKIIDISGREVGSYSFKALEKSHFEESVDVSHLTNGLYLCQFQYDNKQITRKFIKK